MLKVKIVRGDKLHTSSDQSSDYIHWIAGNVKVGTIGELYEQETSNVTHAKMWAIRFPGVTPKSGYFFGISKITDQFELIKDQ